MADGDVILNGVTYNASQFTANGGYGYVALFPAPILSDMLAEIDSRIGLVGESLTATSSSSVAIGTGSKSFTIETGKAFTVGGYLSIFYDSTNYLIGSVTSYNPTTGALVVDVPTGYSVGTGTYATWAINISGPPLPPTSAGTNFTSPPTCPASAANTDSTAMPNTAWVQDEINAAETKIVFTDITTNNASTTKHGFSPKVVAPASGNLNILGVANGETVRADKLLLDTTTPTTQAFGDAASAGTAVKAARIDHKHAMPATPVSPVGKHTIAIPANAIKPRTSNGCAPLNWLETTTNKVMVPYLAFDSAVVEYAVLPPILLPKSYNLGTVTFEALFAQNDTGTGGVVFSLQALARGNDDALDTAYGTAVTAAATAGTLGDTYKTAESGTITIAGTPADFDIYFFQIAREVANASDTLAFDALLEGVRLFFTIDAGTDA